jgi:hypothetical protein
MRLVGCRLPAGFCLLGDPGVWLPAELTKNLFSVNVWAAWDACRGWCFWWVGVISQLLENLMIGGRDVFSV